MAADFTYNVDFIGNTTMLKQSITAFQKDTSKDITFDINANLPDNIANTGAVTQAFNQMKIAAKDVSEVIYETTRQLNAQGVAEDHITGIKVKHTNALGQFVTSSTKVTNAQEMINAKSKEYEALLKKTDATLNSTQNVRKELREKIVATANSLKTEIESWQKLDKSQQSNLGVAQEHQRRIEGLSTELARLKGETVTGANATQNFATRMGNAIKQSFAYGLAIRAMRIAQQEFNKAIKYTIDLNTEMTKIKVLQVEGAKTTYEIDRLADSFNRLAQEMGATTLQVAEGSVEWLRQGKTIQETQELLRSTLMLSKLGDLDAAESTKYLTSTLNGYKMAASEATSVVDKLVAVDNVAATSVAELATALQYSAAIANQTGVSFEQLVSYIGTVSETTRQNAESIGQGMKTMLTRMQDIKAGKIDEDGLGINNVELALDKANIALRSSDTEFRDFGTVLEELAGKWDTLTGTEQAYVAKSIAGIRQVNMFTVMMQNMDRALELQEVQFSSAGLAANRYQIYMESLEAKIATFKATLEGLYQDAIESGFIGSLIDAGTNTLKWVESVGGLEAVVKRLAVAFVTLKVAMFALTNYTTLDNIAKGLTFFAGNAPAFQGAIQGILKGLTDSGKGASGLATILKKLVPAATGVVPSISAAGTAASGAAISFGALATAVLPWIVAAGVVIGVGVALEKSIVTQKEAYEEMAKAQEESAEIGDNISAIGALQTRYYELQKAQKDDTKSVEEQIKIREDLDDVIDELARKLPNLAVAYDAEGKSIEIVNNSLERQIGFLKTLQEEKDKAAKESANEFLFEKVSSDNGRGYIETTDIADTGKLESLYKKAKKTNDWADFDAELNQYAEAFNNIGVEGAEYFIKTLRFGIDENLANYLKEMVNEFAEAEEKSGLSRAASAYASNYAAQEADYYKDNYDYTDIQAENAAKYGTGEELNEHLYSEVLPGYVEQLKTFEDAIEKVSKAEFVSPEQLTSLENLKVTFNETTQQFEYQNGANKEVISTKEQLMDIIKKELGGNYALEDINWQLIETMLAGKEAAEELADSYKVLESAIQEQSKNGEISNETALALVESNGELAHLLTKTATGYTLAAEDAYDYAQAALAAKFATELETASANATEEGMRYLLNAQLAAASGNYVLAQSHLNAASAAGVQANVVQNLKGLLTQMASLFGAINAPGGSGSSGSGEDPRIKEQEEIIEGLEDEIDLYEKQKDALEETRDEYGEWIDAKKEALQLTKEENDYYKEQQDRVKSLSKIKKEMAMLELDNTEEAIARRMELEEEAAKLEGDIAENTEERKYDLQIQAYDKLKDAFDKMIDEQIAAIDAIIDKIKEQIDAIKEVIEELREGGGGGSFGRGVAGGDNTSPYEAGNPPNSEPLTGEEIIYIWDEKTQSYIAMPTNTSVVEQGTRGLTHRSGYMYDIRDNMALDENGNVIPNAINSPIEGTLSFGNDSDAYGTYAEILSLDKKTRYKIGHVYGTLQEAMDYAANALNLKVGDVVQAGQQINLGDPKFYTHIEKWAIDELGNKVMVDIEQLQEDNKDTWAIINKGWQEGVSEYANLTDEFKDNQEQFATLANDGIISLDEAFQNNITVLGDNVEGFVAEVGGVLRSFQFSVQKKGWVETTPDALSSIEDARLKALKLALQNRNAVNPLFLHSGGLVESHHDGDFAGNLKSNEVFSKLLKGEYVATEHQMDNFLKNVLPTIGANMVTSKVQPTTISVNMPITVEGNLDKSVVPDIKNIANMVIGEINKSLTMRGYVRTSNQTIS